MRKIIYIVTLIFTLLILVACQNKKLSDILDIKEDKVQKIVVETTMTEDKSDLVLEKKRL